MTQNIYDDEEFFAGYSRLRRSVEGLDGAPEWPALRALLPNLSGLKVLDLGCGFGWFCRWARQQGAAYVLGIDVSEKMLARARGEGDDPAITYRNADMEKLDLPANSFNLVYSSLALHYVGNLNGLMLQVDRSLVRGGRLVFSVEHPIFTATSEPNWSPNAAGRNIWPVDGYLDEGPRSRNGVRPRSRSRPSRTGPMSSSARRFCSWLQDAAAEVREIRRRVGARWARCSRAGPRGGPSRAGSRRGARSAPNGAAVRPARRCQSTSGRCRLAG